MKENKNYRKSPPNYCIQATSYNYKLIGVDENGKNLYEKVGNPVVSNCKGVGNFSELKKQLYETTKKRKDVFVNYEELQYKIKEQPRRVKSVVRTNADGSRVVTYYKAIDCEN